MKQFKIPFKLLVLPLFFIMDAVFSLLSMYVQDNFGYICLISVPCMLIILLYFGMWLYKLIHHKIQSTPSAVLYRMMMLLMSILTFADYCLTQARFGYSMIGRTLLDCIILILSFIFFIFTILFFKSSQSVQENEPRKDFFQGLYPILLLVLFGIVALENIIFDSMIFNIGILLFNPYMLLAYLIYYLCYFIFSKQKNSIRYYLYHGLVILSLLLLCNNQWIVEKTALQAIQYIFSSLVILCCLVGVFDMINYWQKNKMVLQLYETQFQVKKELLKSILPLLLITTSIVFSILSILKIQFEAINGFIILMNFMITICYFTSFIETIKINRINRYLLLPLLYQTISSLLLLLLLIPFRLRLPYYPFDILIITIGILSLCAYLLIVIKKYK